MGNEKDEELALDHIDRISTIYNNMGTGLLTFNHIVKKETFMVVFRHIPSKAEYQFEFDKNVTLDEFTETVRSVIHSKIGSARTKGIVS